MSAVPSIYTGGLYLVPNTPITILKNGSVHRAEEFPYRFDGLALTRAATGERVFYTPQSGLMREHNTLFFDKPYVDTSAARKALESLGFNITPSTRPKDTYAFSDPKVVDTQILPTPPPSCQKKTTLGYEKVMADFERAREHQTKMFVTLEIEDYCIRYAGRGAIPVWFDVPDNHWRKLTLQQLFKAAGFTLSYDTNELTPCNDAPVDSLGATFKLNSLSPLEHYRRKVIRACEDKHRVTSWIAFVPSHIQDNPDIMGPLTEWMDSEDLVIIECSSRYFEFTVKEMTKKNIYADHPLE